MYLLLDIKEDSREGGKRGIDRSVQLAANSTTPGKSLPWEVEEKITEKNRGLGVLPLTTDCQYGRIKFCGTDQEQFNVMCAD